MGKKETPPCSLPWKRERFCLEYVKDGNATRAAIRAGFSERSAYSQAHRLLRNVEIRARIQEVQREIARELKITHADILQRLWSIATADVNDLIRVERRACRHCHGADHAYQWKTHREYNDAVERFLHDLSGGDPKVLYELGDRIDAGQTVPGMPSDAGGYGFDATAEPAAECPECAGEGVETVQVEDTREALSPPLYEGVKQTRDGIEIKIADRARALEQIARHLSFFNDTVQVSASEELQEA